MKNKFLRLAIEIGFIMFLFYANLLMGDYTNSQIHRTKGLLWALKDVFTINSFIIGLAAAVIGYILFEYLRKLL